MQGVSPPGVGSSLQVAAVVSRDRVPLADGDPTSAHTASTYLYLFLVSW